MAKPPKAEQMPIIDGAQALTDDGPITDGPNPTTEVESEGGSKKEQRQEFFIPVTGFVWCYPEEVTVINHPAFQRLGKIYQLGQTYLVYRGATHKRLEHVLGALSTVQRMIEAVDHNGRKQPRAGVKNTRELTEPEKRFIRLGALLHDVGHVAAGHTVEDELRLIGKHDEDRRLALVFNSRDFADQENRTLGEVVDQEFRKYVPKSLRNKLTASGILRHIIRKQPEEDKEKPPFDDERKLLENSKDIQLDVARNMIGNTICADLLDYLHRDWYHIGKPRPFDDRILQYMEVRKGRPDKFVISLGKRPKVRTDAVSAILELLEWRYQLFEAVLFHRTKMAAAAMLDRALFELWSDTGEDIEPFVLHLSDEEMISACRRRAEERKKEIGATVALNLLTALEKRALFTGLTTRFYDDLPPDVVASVQRTYEDTPTDGRVAPQNRNRVLRVLESDFDLPPGSLAMYSGGVSAKIAKVKIAVGDDIEQFNDYEHKHNDQLSGGHLDAQLKRFRRLWRVHFFIDRKVKEGLGERLNLLRQAVEKLAIGSLTDDEDSTKVAKSIAGILTQVEGSPFKGWTVGEGVAAAYQSQNTATGSYPLGNNSIRSFLISPKE